MKVVQAKVCLLGDFAVGKTSLVRRYLEGRFDDKYLSTIGVKISRKTLSRKDHDLHLLLWDLASGEHFVQFEENYLRGAAGALVVCDLTRPETLPHLAHYAGQLRAQNPQAGLIFLGNKADLTADCRISKEELEAAGQGLGARSLLTSAKTGEGVEQAFESLAQWIEAVYGYSAS